MRDLRQKFSDLLASVDAASLVPDARVVEAEGALVLDVDKNCRSCGKPLTLEEMHYYAYEDNSATCTECETKWMEAVAAWRDSGKGEMPPRP